MAVYVFCAEPSLGGNPAEVLAAWCASLYAGGFCRISCNAGSANWRLNSGLNPKTEANALVRCGRPSSCVGTAAATAGRC